MNFACDFGPREQIPMRFRTLRSCDPVLRYFPLFHCIDILIYAGGHHPSADEQHYGPHHPDQVHLKNFCSVGKRFLILCFFSVGLLVGFAVLSLLPVLLKNKLKDKFD